jgi:hypothetical protein
MKGRKSENLKINDLDPFIGSNSNSEIRRGRVLGTQVPAK